MTTSYPSSKTAAKTWISSMVCTYVHGVCLILLSTSWSGLRQHICTHLYVNLYNALRGLVWPVRPSRSAHGVTAACWDSLANQTTRVTELVLRHIYVCTCYPLLQHAHTRTHTHTTKGDFFISEMIESQDQEHRTVVAEVMCMHIALNAASVCTSAQGHTAMVFSWVYVLV